MDKDSRYLCGIINSIGSIDKEKIHPLVFMLKTKENIFNNVFFTYKNNSPYSTNLQLKIEFLVETGYISENIDHEYFLKNPELTPEKDSLDKNLEEPLQKLNLLPKIELEKTATFNYLKMYGYNEQSANKKTAFLFS